MIITALVALVCTAQPAQASAEAPAQPDSDRFEIVWHGPRGGAWRLPASIERPEPHNDTGYAVMLFGGGLSADLDWTVPGTLEWQGELQQLTIDGEDTTDAQSLSEALTAAGFTVLRYSSIRVDDPLHAENRGMADAVPFSATIGMGRVVWDALRERAELEPDRVVVLGHSLGATRACLATEGEAAGFVFLAGAYVSPTSERPSELAAQALEAFGGAGPDGLVQPEEFDAWTEAHPEDGMSALSFDALDADDSGAISGWELAGAIRVASGLEPLQPTIDAGGTLTWPSQILKRADRPVLAIWGGQDPMSMHGPVLGAIARTNDLDVTQIYFDELGHQLGEVGEQGRTGPIGDEVVETIVSWLRERFGEIK